MKYSQSLSVLLGFSLLPSLATAYGISWGKPTCYPVSFPLEVSAQSLIYADPPDRTNETDILLWLAETMTTPVSGERTVAGTFVLKGTYCSPPRGVASKGVLEILVHGATYNQEMWFAYGISDANNWPLFAAQQGYHTLTIDRLSHGQDPTKPDPLDIVQVPLELEIIHALITKIRAGPHPGGRSKNGLPRGFDKVVYVGHSLGSITGNIFLQRHPADVDAFVNTGMTLNANIQSLLDGVFRSAVNVDPIRFRGLDLGYLTTATYEVRRDGFYAGEFEERIARVDWERKDTLALGEFATTSLGFAQAADYTGKVLFVTGLRDSIMYDPADGPCEDVLLSSAHFLFPNATTKDALCPDVGHDLTLHVAAPQIFADIHQWIDSVL